MTIKHCEQCLIDESGMCDSCANEELKKLNAMHEINIKPSEVELLRAENLRLVAENAALEAANDEGKKWDGEQWIGLSIETSATEADIADIKAQGVDEFSSEIGKLCDELKLGSMSWKAAKSIVMRAGRNG